MCCLFYKNAYLSVCQCVSPSLLVKIMTCHIAQFFDGEIIDGFDAKLAVHQKFPVT